MQERALARKVYERSLSDELREDEKTDDLYIKFARFESRMGEYERSQAILNFAIEALPDSTRLYATKIALERQFGSRARSRQYSGKAARCLRGSSS